jgi:hypothetical protein
MARDCGPNYSGSRSNPVTNKTNIRLICPFRLSLAYSFLFMAGRKINKTCIFIYTDFQILKLRTCLWELMGLD